MLIVGPEHTMRILQLTISAIAFMVVSGLSFLVIETWTGGRLQEWRSAPFTGSVGDECLATELAMLPLVLGILTCWGIVRLFRMRSVHNEIDDTFRPVLAVAAGYGRFALIVVSGTYLVLGHGWAAFTHFGIAVVAFAVFYRVHRARERAVEGRLLAGREEDENENPHCTAQPGASPNGGPGTRLGGSRVTGGPPSVS
jgi:hypothetical protein